MARSGASVAPGVDARPGVEFRVLGPVEALADDVPIDLGGPRQRALLAVLLLKPNRTVSSSFLIDEIWRGQPPEGAETTLRSYVSRLRRALGGGASVTATPAGYTLHVVPELIDAIRFERLIGDADESLARRTFQRAERAATEALALWRGDPVGGLGAYGALQIEAERIEELRLHALEIRFEAALALGRAAELVDELEALAKGHPYRERLWRQLMLALYRADRQADALAAYHHARQILDEQLGIEPGEEIEQLQLAILRQEVPRVTSPEDKHNLPAPLTSFVGRTAERDAIASLMQTHRLVTLTGVGGVGKTRLAIEVARRAVSDYADGVRFIDLAPLTDSLLVPGHVARVLGAHEQSGIDPQSMLATRFRDADLLIVLDNCEHLLQACAELGVTLLSSAPRLQILATSRERLGVPGEVDYAVEPLPISGTADGPNADPASDAAALFLDRARQGRPGLQVDESVLATAQQIAVALDGLPLAIELAAARAKGLSLETIAAEISDRFRFLVSWRRLSPARHRTLKEAIDWSYDLLSEEERRLLAELAVFAGGFTIDAVASVCFDGERQRALLGVERLVDASLVVPVARDGEARYRLLETVREYAANRLDELGEQARVRRRHAELFAAFAEASYIPIRRRDPQLWVDRLSNELDNLRAALAWARDAGDDFLLAALSEALWWFWWIHGDISEGRSWLGLAMERWDQVPIGLRGRILYGAAGLAWAQGDLDAAERLAGEARSIFQSVDAIEGSPGTTDIEWWRGAALNTLGLIAQEREDWAASEALLEQALESYELIADDYWRDQGLGVAQFNLATMALGRGDFERALRLSRKARSRFEALEDTEGVAMTDLGSGQLRVLQGRYSDAAPFFRDALIAYERVGFLHYLAQTIEGAAYVAHSRGESRAAVTLIAAASVMRDRTGHQPTQKIGAFHESVLAKLRQTLGEASFEDAWQEGRAFRRGEAGRRALAALADAPTPR